MGVRIYSSGITPGISKKFRNNRKKVTFTVGEVNQTFAFNSLKKVRDEKWETKKREIDKLLRVNP